MDGRSLVPSDRWVRRLAVRTARWCSSMRPTATKRYAICEFTGIWSKRETLRRYTSIAGEGGRCEDTDILERYDLRDDPLRASEPVRGRAARTDGRQAALEAKLEELGELRRDRGSRPRAAPAANTASRRRGAGGSGEYTRPTRWNPAPRPRRDLSPGAPAPPSACGGR